MKRLITPFEQLFVKIWTAIREADEQKDDGVRCDIFPSKLGTIIHHLN